MTRYVTIRMTREQAQAASNACDSLRADGDKREAAIYARASVTLDQARSANNPGQPRRKPRR